MTEPASDSPALDLGQLAAAVTAVVGILASLAVSGILGQAQRNHGSSLLVALGFVLLGVLLWTLAAVKAGRSHPWLHYLGAFAFFVGLLLAIITLVVTQHDTERPAVSGTFDTTTRLLRATVRADGLSLEDRLVVRIEGLRQLKGTTRFRALSPPLYFALLGPNSDGKINHTAIAYVPKRAQFVGVKAWTAKTEPACFVAAAVRPGSTPRAKPQSQEAGCFVLRLPQAANKKKQRS